MGRRLQLREVTDEERQHLRPASRLWGVVC